MTDLATTVAALAARVEELEVRAEAQDAEKAALMAEVDDLRQRGATPEVPGAGPIDRRAALRTGLGLVGAAATGAVLFDGGPAAATPGQPILASYPNSSTLLTQLDHSGTDVALLLNSPNGTGLAVNTKRGGIDVAAGHHHLYLVPRPGRDLPIRDTTAHLAGEVVIDAYSNLWLCIADGTPGTWRSLSGNAAAGAYYPLATPVRAYDSRPGTTPAQGPKTKLNGTHTIDLTATGVYDFSTSVVLNVLLVNATAGNGNFTVWAEGSPRPQANTLVWGGTAGRFSTLAVSRARLGKVHVNASLATDVVIDVVGHHF